MLNALSAPGIHEQITEKTAYLTAGLRERASAAGVPFLTNEVGGMFGLFFTEQQQVNRYSEVMACDKERFNHFFHGMLNEGVYLAPAFYEACFMSLAHDDQALQHTLDAAERVMAKL